jgi:alanyl-tRNA synthetase
MESLYTQALNDWNMLMNPTMFHKPKTPSEKESFRIMLDAYRQNYKGAGLGADIADKPLVMVSSGSAAQQQGVRAGDLAKLAAGVLGGGGGGKADFAQGGGTDSSKLVAAIHEAVAAIK